MRALRNGFALAVIILAAAIQAGAQSFYLKPGDRVVFYGDSITDQRLYTSFVETFCVTRFPKMPLSFVHSGWGGDRVTGGGGGPIDLRLNRDVIAYHPTVMTIMLGMNDASYRPFDQAIFDTYRAGYEHIVDKMKAAVPGLRITVIEPSPFDDVTFQPRFPGGYNAVLLKYADFVKDLALKNNLQVADLNRPVTAALEKAKELDAAGSQKIIPDRVHPGPGGHLLMAEALLKAWGAPSLVSSVDLDVAGNGRIDAANTRITGFHNGGGTVTWTQTDNALPLALDMKDAPLALAVRSSDVVQALNQQPLKVAGLSGARYKLLIDGEEAGVFTSAELAKGINLAILPTPMAKQAAEVHAYTLRHNNVHFLRWRTIQVPYSNEQASGLSPNSPGLAKALAGLDALEADLIAKQRAAAQPRPRRYELISQ